MENLPLKQIIEGAIMAAETPLSVEQIMQLFEQDPPERAAVRDALTEIENDCENRGFELKQVASGYRFQVRADYGEWVARLWKERPPRYTRATLETLALIAYKQPITRGDIEEIRGVAVSTNIIRSLLEREWIRVVGHRDVPGQPALLATTKTFLDYFNLRNLDELPSLAEIRDLTKLNEELELDEDLIEARTLEIDPEEEEAVAGINDEDLDAVSQQVDTIQQNIRSMFEPDEETASDDQFEDSDDTDDVVIPLNTETTESPSEEHVSPDDASTPAEPDDRQPS